MIRKMVWLLAVAVAVACAPGPEGTTAGNAAAVAAAEALDRARACADDLDRAGAVDAEAVARALPVEPVRIAPFRGTPREAAAVRSEVADRLETARAHAAAARALASTQEIGTVRLAEERAVKAIRASDELCRAASTLPSERLARRPAER